MSNNVSETIASLGSPDVLRQSAKRARSRMKGRQPEAQALADVQALIGRLTDAWATSELIAESVDSMQLRLIAAE